MSKKFLMIKRLVRTPQFDTSDELILSPGVNVIVGRGNTGKTKWLQMLDYLMGDKDDPNEAFGDLANKYDTIKALISIDNDEFWVERRWKQHGAKGKVFIENDPRDTADYQRFLLERLRIPLVHFPKGNPYEERTWPELSWRVIFRHIYRQQRFWGDLADKQPESEQHASLMQFLGIAQHLFSEKSGNLVQKRKEIWKLQGAREQYLSMLDEISREILDEKEVKVALTADSLDLAITRIREEIQTLQLNREESLSKLRTSVEIEPTGNVGEKSPVDELSESWAQFKTEKDENINWLNKADKRLAELQAYKTSIASEMSKLERAKSASSVFENLKVTHCPVCDQPVNFKSDSEHCFLCGKTWIQVKELDNDRLNVEMVRLQEDLLEVNDLIKQITSEILERRRFLLKLDEQIVLIENRLKPVRAAAASILPPDLTVYDMEIGRLQERIRQLERIKATLSYYRALSDKIDALKKEEEGLSLAVELENQKIHFELSAEKLADGMNTYLNSLVASDSKLWTYNKGVTFTLKEKGFKFTVANENWSTKLGGTLALYFLLSYHYGLLKLSTDLECNYPGLMILDFPANMEDGSTIRDKENFIIEPFVALMNKPGMETTQAIITGAAFENLQGVNRIELNKVWL